MENKFKLKDEVIVRNRQYNGAWFYAVISHYTDEYYVLCGGLVCRHDTYDFLPLKGNEHLIGTKNEPETPLLLKGELVLAFCDLDDLMNCFLVLGHFRGVDEKNGTIIINSGHGTNFRYCVPFLRYNQSDYAATKAEVITVSEDTHRLMKLKDNKGTIVTGY